MTSFQKPGLFPSHERWQEFESFLLLQAPHKIAIRVIIHSLNKNTREYLHTLSSSQSSISGDVIALDSHGKDMNIGRINRLGPYQ